VGFEITWDNNEKSVVLQRYIEPANKNDLIQLAQKSSEMLKTVPHVVHIIIDERNIKLMLNKTDLQYLEQLVPGNQGAVVMIVPQGQVPYKLISQQLGKMLAPKSVNRSYFAPTLEEARTILQQKFPVVYP
jgi:hypothetical protein